MICFVGALSKTKPPILIDGRRLGVGQWRKKLGRGSRGHVLLRDPTPPVFPSKDNSTRVASLCELHLGGTYNSISFGTETIEFIYRTGWIMVVN